MNNVSELKSRYNQIYPAFGSYTGISSSCIHNYFIFHTIGVAECMSRALFTGLSSSILGISHRFNAGYGKYKIIFFIIFFFQGFSTAFCVQHLLKNKLPYPISGNILVSSFVAVVVGFQVTSVRAQSCQAAWLAAEEKHTFFTENDSKSD